MCRDRCACLFRKKVLKQNENEHEINSIFPSRQEDKKKIATDLAHVTVMYVAQTSLAVEITACVQSENTQLDISEDTKQQRPIEICQ